MSGETSRLLLDGGADPNARDEEGKTSLTLAIHQGHDETAALLRERGRPKTPARLGYAILGELPAPSVKPTGQGPTSGKPSSAGIRCRLRSRGTGLAT